MKKNPHAFGAIMLFVFALTSCGGSVSTSDEAGIQTVVAGTLQALTATAPEVAATSTPSDATAANVTFEDISFHLDDQLASGMSYEITVADDPAASPGAMFWDPSYYQLNFEGFVTADPLQEYPITWRLPRMFVIPVENMQSFPSGGYGLEDLAQLQNILSTKPTAISESMPILPYSKIPANRAESWHSNLRYLDFHNGSGVRFLAEFSQFPAPSTGHSAYIFLGLTNDGRNYVSLAMPVNHTALDQYNEPYRDGKLSDPAVFNTFMENYESYLIGANAILESTPDSSFMPDLGRLDDLVRSLSVKP